MSDAQPLCQSPNCGLPIQTIPGHRRRQYCDDACKMAAHRARVEAENRARYEALQLKVAMQEREELRQRWGDLLPESFDVLRHLRIAYGIAVADQVARAIVAERDWARHNQVEERTALVEALMLLGEQIGFQALVTEDFDLESGLENWLDFCNDASLVRVRLARDAAHLKVQAMNGRRKLAHPTPQHT